MVLLLEALGCGVFGDECWWVRISSLVVLLMGDDGVMVVVSGEGAGLRWSKRGVRRWKGDVKV